MKAKAKSKGKNMKERPEIESILKKAAKNAAAGCSAAGGGAASLAVAGGSLSASGITGGLALLGCGSMLLGIGTIALIGAGIYKGVNLLLE